MYIHALFYACLMPCWQRLLPIYSLSLHMLKLNITYFITLLRSVRQ